MFLFSVVVVVVVDHNIDEENWSSSLNLKQNKEKRILIASEVKRNICLCSKLKSIRMKMRKNARENFFFFVVFFSSFGFVCWPCDGQMKTHCQNRLTTVRIHFFVWPQRKVIDFAFSTVSQTDGFFFY